MPAPLNADSPPRPLLSHQNTAGNTALHWASLNGHLEAVKTLVMDGNADPTLTNAVGHDVVYEAELNDRKDVVDWLLGQCEDFEQGVAGSAEEQDKEEEESKETGDDDTPNEQLASLKV